MVDLGIEFNPIVGVIVGNQNSGKSSFVNRLIGIMLSTTHMKRCTLTPIHLKCYPLPSYSNPYVILNNRSTSKIYKEDFHKIPDKINDLMKSKIGKSNFSMESVVIEIHHPNLSRIELIDNPGLVSSLKTPEPHNICKKYITTHFNTEDYTPYIFIMTNAMGSDVDCGLFSNCIGQVKFDMNLSDDQIEKFVRKDIIHISTKPDLYPLEDHNDKMTLSQIIKSHINGENTKKAKTDNVLDLIEQKGVVRNYDTMLDKERKNETLDLSDTEYARQMENNFFDQLFEGNDNYEEIKPYLGVDNAMRMISNSIYISFANQKKYYMNRLVDHFKSKDRMIKIWGFDEDMDYSDDSTMQKILNRIIESFINVFMEQYQRNHIEILHEYFDQCYIEKRKKEDSPKKDKKPKKTESGKKIKQLNIIIVEKTDRLSEASDISEKRELQEEIDALKSDLIDHQSECKKDELYDDEADYIKPGEDYISKITINTEYLNKNLKYDNIDDKVSKMLSNNIINNDKYIIENVELTISKLYELISNNLKYLYSNKYFKRFPELELKIKRILKIQFNVIIKDSMIKNIKQLIINRNKLIKEFIKTQIKEYKNLSDYENKIVFEKYWGNEVLNRVIHYYLHELNIQIKRSIIDHSYEFITSFKNNIASISDIDIVRYKNYHKEYKTIFDDYKKIRKVITKFVYFFDGELKEQTTNDMIIEAEKDSLHSLIDDLRGKIDDGVYDDYNYDKGYGVGCGEGYAG